MASIVKLKGKWRALIRRKGHDPISKWFDTKAKAIVWAADIEAQLMGGAPAKKAASQETIADMIQRFRIMRGKAKPILDTSTEHYTLKQLAANLGHIVAADLSSDDLLTWAHGRREDGAGPYTINCDLSKLGTVYRYTAAAIPASIDQVRPKLAYLGLIGGGGTRERRPTEEEYILLIEFFAEKHGAKYVDAIDFAGITAMRRGEVCAVKFTDLDDKTRLARVMRKHPRKGKVLQLVPLVGLSWDIAMAQPRDDPEGRIFPIHPQTLSKYFTEACKALGIPDLHLHDFRHEGTSALFELGYGPERVALVTGHKDWRNLKRYTNLKPESMIKKP